MSDVLGCLEFSLACAVRCSRAVGVDPLNTEMHRQSQLVPMDSRGFVHPVLRKLYSSELGLGRDFRTKDPSWEPQMNKPLVDMGCPLFSRIQPSMGTRLCALNGARCEADHHPTLSDSQCCALAVSGWRKPRAIGLKIG